MIVGFKSQWFQSEENGTIEAFQQTFAAVKCLVESFVFCIWRQNLQTAGVLSL